MKVEGGGGGWVNSRERKLQSFMFKECLSFGFISILVWFLFASLYFILFFFVLKICFY